MPVQDIHRGAHNRCVVACGFKTGQGTAIYFPVPWRPIEQVWREEGGGGAGFSIQSTPTTRLRLRANTALNQYGGQTHCCRRMRHLCTPLGTGANNVRFPFSGMI